MSITTVDSRSLSPNSTLASRPTRSAVSTGPSPMDRFEPSRSGAKLYSSEALESLREALKSKNIDLFL